MLKIKNLTEVGIQDYINLEMFIRQNLEEKKKKKRKKINKIYFGNSFIPVYPERNHILCSS